MSNYDSAGVYIRERDLSQVIATSGATIAAICGVFSRGSVLKPVLVTDSKQFRSIFGDPDASVSFAGYSVLNFFEKGGQQIYVQRVVAPDAMYGACAIRSDLTTAQSQLSNPLSVDWTVAAGGSGVAAALVYAHGPGSQSANRSFQLSSRNVLPPSVTASVAVAGGTLTATTVYNYIVVAKNTGLAGSLSSGHTVLSATATTTTTNKTVALNWTWDGVASGYDIYQSVAAGAYKFLTSVGLTGLVPTTNALTFSDTGTLTPNAAVTVALPIVAVTEAVFKIKFFDTTIYANTPVEIFDVTWLDAVSGDGVQTQIEQTVNGRSKSFRVALNPLAAPYPVVYNGARQNLSTGTSGSPPTSYMIAAAWDQFADPENITARVFINGGYSDPIVQLKMIQVAETRGDAVAILDAPASAQIDGNPYALVDYRRLTLNANSNRGALYAPDILYADIINGKTLYVPPSGFVAGVFAFTDYTRNAAFQPAGLQRGQLPNALGTRIKYKQVHRDILGPAQINPIVNFPGEGIVPWEGLTLQAAQSGFSFISIRRIFDVIEVSIKKFLKPQIHDPNDDFTRRSILAALNEYLAYWQTQRAIKSFNVDVGDTINPGFITTLGQLNVQILIEPIYPVRFIECTVGLTKAGANFAYLISGNALG